MKTHEQWLHAVREIVATRLVDVLERDKLLGLKLAYGAGPRGVRGSTSYGQWQCSDSGRLTDFLSIMATGEESLPQLAGTLVHELGHALVGPGHGHDSAWKQACARLGLRHVKATNTVYSWAGFDSEVCMVIAALGEPTDGKPKFKETLGGAATGAVAVVVTGCQSGLGTRGGRSRGAGSGSRMRKYVCQCGQIVRAATDTLVAMHIPCGSAFTRK